MKKPLLALLWLLLSALLPGCQPYLTYDEMYAAVEVAETPDAREKLQKRIDRFEADAVRADAFFILRESCQTYENRIWYCYNTGLAERRISQILSRPMTLDGKVKLYRRLRTACACASREDVMNAISY